MPHRNAARALYAFALRAGGRRDQELHRPVQIQRRRHNPLPIPVGRVLRLGHRAEQSEQRERNGAWSGVQRGDETAAPLHAVYNRISLAQALGHRTRERRLHHGNALPRKPAARRADRKRVRRHHRSRGLHTPGESDGRDAGQKDRDRLHKTRHPDGRRTCRTIHKTARKDRKGLFRRRKSTRRHNGRERTYADIPAIKRNRPPTPPKEARKPADETNERGGETLRNAQKRKVRSQRPCPRGGREQKSARRGAKEAEKGRSGAAAAHFDLIFLRRSERFCAPWGLGVSRSGYCF